MSLLRAASKVLHAAAQSTGGVSISLRRGNDSTDGLVAVPLATRQRDYGPEEVHISARDQDWRIWAADYAFGGPSVEPAVGDEIDWIENGVKRTFEVRPRGDERCYRHTDQTRQAYRVFTVEAQPNAE